MARALVVVLSSLGALGAVSCVALLDYGSLQGGAADASAGTGGASGNGGTGAVGGSAGSGGSAASAGSAGSSACGDCDDTDPCTDDLCVESPAPATCRHYSKGVIADGLAESFEADEVPRVTLAANDKGFYGSALFVDAGTPDLQLFAFSPSATSIVAGPRLSTLPPLAGKVAASAAGIAALRSFPFDVVAYAAVHDPSSSSNQLGEVWAISLDQNLVPSEAVRASGVLDDFQLEAQRVRYPIAWQAGNQVLGAWIAGLGEKVLVNSGAGPNTELGTGAAGLFTAVAPLVSVGGKPGVLMLADGFVTTPVGITQMIGSGPVPFALCSPETGVVYDADTGMVGALPGVIFSAFARARGSGGNFYHDAETRFFECADTFCAPDADCHEGVDKLTLDVALEAASKQGEPGVIYEVAATTRIVGDVTNPAVALYLQVIRVDLDQVDAGSSKAVIALLPGLGLEVARSDPKTAPAYPALAVSGADKIGVGWSQSAVAGSKASGHFNRYQLCFPTSDDLTTTRPDGG